MTATKEKEDNVRQVKMSDGRIVEFPGKKRLIKTSEVASVTTRLDFDNGETRVFQPRDDMLVQFALHGAEQKLGDEIAGMKNEDGTAADTDDLVLAIDDLIDRLNAGEWRVARESSGLAGTSVLLRALVEVTGKTTETVRAFLKEKTQGEKMALRTSKKLKPVVDRLEAEKASKGAKVDTDVLFKQLETSTAA